MIYIHFSYIAEKSTISYSVTYYNYFNTG